MNTFQMGSNEGFFPGPSIVGPPSHFRLYHSHTSRDSKMGMGLGIRE